MRIKCDNPPKVLGKYFTQSGAFHTIAVVRGFQECAIGGVRKVQGN